VGGIQDRVDVLRSRRDVILNDVPAILDDSGRFAVAGLDPGTYDLLVKGTHSLSNFREEIAVPDTRAPVSLGTLLEGDASDNDRVAGEDMSILITAYGTSPGGRLGRTCRLQRR